MKEKVKKLSKGKKLSKSFAFVYEGRHFLLWNDLH